MKVYTFEELVKDIKLTSDSFNKKDLKEKYGFKENRIADIEKRLIDMAYELHLEHTSFDESDYKIFNQKFNFPSTVKKLSESFSRESKEFFNFFENYIIKIDKEKSNKRFYKPDTRINALAKIRKENEKNTDNNLKEIISILKDQTSEYKQIFINEIVNGELSRFDFFAPYKGWTADARQGYDYDRKTGISTKYWSLIIRNEKRELIKDTSKFDRKWVQAFNYIKNISEDFNRELFISKVKSLAEERYNYNIELVAEKFNDKSVNPSEINVEYISRDIKGFEMIAKVSNISVHCRSIFCAEFSNYMEAHWRFIATAKNIK